MPRIEPWADGIFHHKPKPFVLYKIVTTLRCFQYTLFPESKFALQIRRNLKTNSPLVKSMNKTIQFSKGKDNLGKNSYKMDASKLNFLRFCLTEVQAR